MPAGFVRAPPSPMMGNPQYIEAQSVYCALSLMFIRAVQEIIFQRRAEIIGFAECPARDETREAHRGIAPCSL